jgi:mRNA interferase MazF
VSKRAFVPSRGDVVWLHFNPQVGNEQAGRRPALVLSPEIYNRSSGLAICCPVRSRTKGYPFEVPVPAGLKVEGVILADQVKSLDWRERKAELICGIPGDTLTDVLERIAVLLA